MAEAAAHTKSILPVDLLEFRITLWSTFISLHATMQSSKVLLIAG